MASLADKLIETIAKDIEELENAQGADSKLIRKECNLIKGRIDSLRKLTTDESKLEGFVQRIEKLLK